MSRALVLLCLPIATLVACSDPPPVAPPAETAAAQPEATAPSAPADTTPMPAPSGPYFATPKPGEELPTSQTTPGPIPLEFRHVWAIDKKDCSADPSHTRMAIAPGAIRFYEGRSVVVAADVPGAGHLTLDVAHSAEGETVRETHVLALDSTGRTLTYQRRGQTFTYTRCD